MPMQIRDQSFWQGQKAEIAQSADRESGEATIRFIEAWCDRAELYLDSALKDNSCTTPLNALRATLNATQEEVGVLPPGWLAHLLLIVVAAWIHGGEELLQSMTVFEQKMVADEAALVNMQLEESAAAAGN